ncbi:MAG: hypothetical protein OQJ96_06100 [Flavobacteriales bacterium]|nr:hypothetical protein [Flavobacteriales bacterium]MCW8937650.1 hypothetical protein [Flavobacteriales bacterium]MCW8967588.1 hypothetical protein [Flavobacteriales bacterium]MCW8990138.1 hypothetical protein [Flavobacteriales bacterium]MCW9019856.1 hypothetical protein [Flavobacteriales bacterium]
MELMENEQTIKTSIKGLVLTNYRIRSEFKILGKGKISSIMLEELSSSQLTYKSKPKLLLFGFIILVISIMGGAYMGVVLHKERNGMDIAIFGAFLFIIFIVLYFVSRHHIVSFSSSSSSIDLKTRGLDFKEIRQLIDTVENAKNAREYSLK